MRGYFQNMIATLARSATGVTRHRPIKRSRPAEPSPCLLAPHSATKQSNGIFLQRQKLSRRMPLSRQCEAEGKFWQNPELVDGFLQFLDPAETPQLALAHKKTRSILKDLDPEELPTYRAGCRPSCSNLDAQEGCQGPHIRCSSLDLRDKYSHPGVPTAYWLPQPLQWSFSL